MEVIPGGPARITLETDRSIRLVACVCLAHGVALISVSILAFAQPVYGLLAVPVVFGLLRCWALFALPCAPSAIRRLEWHGDDTWSIVQGDGRTESGRLLNRSFVSPWLTILSFSTGRLRRRHVLLLPDNADPEQVRRLRVLLRTEADLGAGPG